MTNTYAKLAVLALFGLTSHALELEEIDGYRDVEIAIVDEADRLVPHGEAAARVAGVGLPESLRVRAKLGDAIGETADGLSAFPTELVLALARDTSHFGANYKEVSWSAEGGFHVELTGAPQCHYRGTIHDRNASDASSAVVGKARVSLCGGGGAVRGMLRLVDGEGRSTGRALEIRHVAEGTSARHVAIEPATYRRDAAPSWTDEVVKDPKPNLLEFAVFENSTEATKETTSADDGARRLRANECSTAPNKFIEIVAVNDFRRYSDLGSGTEADTTLLYGLVFDNYHDPADSSGGISDATLNPCVVKPILVGQVTYTATEPWSYAVGPTECSLCGYGDACAAGETGYRCLLNSFREWANGDGELPLRAMFDLPELDSVNLLTHAEFAGSTVGRAYFDGLCNSDFVTINQVNFSPSDDAQATVIAHELGHNIGIEHDAASAPYVMAPSVQNSLSTLLPFSDSSKTQANDFLELIYGDIDNWLDGITPEASPLCLENDPADTSCPAASLNAPTQVMLYGTSTRADVGGTYVVVSDVFCACRPAYACIDCAVDATLLYDESDAEWVVTTGTANRYACATAADDARVAARVPLSPAYTPAGIAGEWLEVPAGGGSAVANAAMEVRYDIVVSGSAGFSINGQYQRQGSCDNRPSFVCQDCFFTRILRYASAFRLWQFTPSTTCPDLLYNGIVLDTAEVPTSIAAEWRRYTGSDTVPDPGVTMAFALDVDPVTAAPTDAPTAGASSCPAGYTESTASDKCYTVGGTSQRWQDCKSACDGLGAKMLCPQSEDENQFIYDTYFSGTNLWLAYRDWQPDGNFQWRGCSSTYTNWRGGEPDRFTDAGLNGYAYIRGNGLWNDNKKNKKYNCICETASA